MPRKQQQTIVNRPFQQCLWGIKNLRNSVYRDFLPVMCPLCSFNSWAFTHWVPLFLYIWTSWLFGLIAISVIEKQCKRWGIGAEIIKAWTQTTSMNKCQWKFSYGSCPGSTHGMWWVPTKTGGVTWSSNNVHLCLKRNAIMFDWYASNVRIIRIGRAVFNSFDMYIYLLADGLSKAT